MMTKLQQPELQQRTLRLYGELLCRKSDWAGQLVVAAFAGAASSGLAAAASLAGAASLTVDADSAAMKAHFRDGAFDFVVNTLDEALRALKNEIRRGRSIALGLVADPNEVLQEAAKRGVAATLVLTASEDATESERSIVEVGGSVVSSDAASATSPELRAWLEQKRWSPAFVAPSAFGEDAIRERWMRNLSAHQLSIGKGDRWMWLQRSE